MIIEWYEIALAYSYLLVVCYVGTAVFVTVILEICFKGPFDFSETMDCEYPEDTRFHVFCLAVLILVWVVSYQISEKCGFS